MKKNSFEELKNEFKEKQSTFTSEELVELSAYGYISIKCDAKTLGVGESQ